MPKQFLRRLTSLERSEHADIILGITLAFIAGAINAGGFLVVGFYTSHMSGIASSIGDHVALHEWHLVGLAVAFLVSFLSGAIACALITNAARARELASEYALPLLVEALLLLVFGLIANNLSGGRDTFYIICLLCFIMGLQNAIITKISKSVIRTTHITGITTDLGIELGRFLARTFHIHREAIFRSQRCAVLLGLLCAFIFGGVAGAFSFKLIGFTTTVPLALILMLFAIVPIMDDMASGRG